MGENKATSAVRVRNVVLDAGPIIKGHALNMHLIAEKIYTVPEVITEIRDSKSRDMLERMPFLEIREPTQQAVKAVCDFATKSGDLAALSVTDLKLCALTYALEAELVGTKHIRTEPVAVKVNVGSQPRSKQRSETSTNASTTASVAGDESKESDSQETEAATEVAAGERADEQQPETDEAAEEAGHESEDCAESEDGGEEDTEVEADADVQNLAQNIEATTLADQSTVSAEAAASTESQQAENGSIDTAQQQSHQNVQAASAPTDPGPAMQHAAPRQLGAAADSRFISLKGNFGATGGMTEADDDGQGWINPENVTECVASGRGMLSGQRTSGNRNSRKPRVATVACCTTDFSMQNLLMRMNLQVCAVDGVRVTQVKQFVLRCNGCYTIHFETSRMFCSKCGNHHLYRVSSSIDSRTGELRLHLKKNYHYDTTGMRYNLPKPGKGNRYEGELLLREDQLLYGVWRQKSRQAAKALKSSFGEDITADVGLNLKAQAQLQYGLGRKNPNTQRGRERRGKKKR